MYLPTFRPRSLMMGAGGGLWLQTSPQQASSAILLSWYRLFFPHLNKQFRHFLISAKEFLNLQTLLLVVVVVVCAK
jgi:hypothetical protein